MEKMPDLIFRGLRISNADKIVSSMANSQGMYMKSNLTLEFGEPDTNHYVRISIQVNGNDTTLFDVAKIVNSGRLSVVISEL